jgi:oxygen-independent coproporphyrinogen III oxidase
MENLNTKDIINEYLMTSLRTAWGIDFNHLTELSYNLAEVHGVYIDQLKKNGLATVDGAFLQLTKKGRLLADKISADLFIS